MIAYQPAAINLLRARTDYIYNNRGTGNELCEQRVCLKPGSQYYVTLK